MSLTIFLNGFFQCHNFFRLVFVRCHGYLVLQTKKLCNVHGEEALKDRKCRNWFDEFRSGDFLLKDEQLSDWPNETHDQIKAIIYCRQVNKLNAVVKEKRTELVNRKGVIFHHDNATPQTSLATRRK